MASGTDVQLGRRLKARRLKLTMSRSEMERTTGIGRNRIARLERGEGLLRPSEMAAVLSGYQVSMAEWIGGGVLDRATPKQLDDVMRMTDGEFQAVAEFIERLVKGRATPPA